MMNGNNGPPLLDDVVGNVLMNDDSNGVVLHGNEGSAGVSQPTPMFERLVTEEVQELKTYVRIVENQNRRLAELEKVQSDLENRLEIESVCRQHLEATLETREREWAEKIEHVESDRDQWKHLVEVEKLKNSKLIDQVVRKDQDIHRMLQRKVRTYTAPWPYGFAPCNFRSRWLNLFLGHSFSFCSTITRAFDRYVAYEPVTMKC
jgi:hypothetical protein